MKSEDHDLLLERIRELEARLEEAEETLRAIGSGEVDAIVVSRADSERVYTLKGADEAYRILVEQMGEGAATLSEGGLILFCNRQFAALLGLPLERAIGSRIQEFLPPESQSVLSALLTSDAKAEVRLKRGDGTSVPVYFSARRLDQDGTNWVSLIATDLTEQKRNEEIVAAERLARSILEQAAGTILVVDPSGRIIRASRAAERMAGAPVLLRQFDTVFPLQVDGETGYPFPAILSTLRQSGEIRGLHATARMPDGRMLDLIVNAGVLASGGSELLGCVLILSDVTEMKRIESSLRESIALREKAELAERFQRQRFETTLASIGDAVIATDVEGRVTFMNATAADLTGWAESEALGQHIEAVFNIRNEETGAKVEDPLVRAAREGCVVGLANHTLLISKDGRSRPIDDSGAPIVGPSGELAGAVLVFRDVSEERARQYELLERNRMIDLAHDAVIVSDAERRIKHWNTGAWELYGWEKSEAVGQAAHQLLNTRGTDLQTRERSLRDRGRWEGELIHTCKDGREVIVESRHVLLRDATGEVTGFLQINRDVTERRRTESELRRVAAEAEEGRRTLLALLDHIPEGIVVADAPDGRVRMMSRHGLQMISRPPESLIGSKVQDYPRSWGILHTDGKTIPRPEELPLARAILAGEVTINEEWLIAHPDGNFVPVLSTAAPIRDGDGKITGGLIAWRDISERIKLEQRVREAAKLESLGILAGGIAHDFNNLLTGVIGNADLLLEEVREGTPAWSFAKGIVKSAERAAKLTQQMRAYSGRGRFVVETVDLSKYIRETLSLIYASIPKNVELRLDLASDLPLVEADAAQLQQLVMNLLVNGAEAIGPEGGRLEIVTRAEQVGDKEIRGLIGNTDMRPGLYVALEVRDSGRGMDEATLARIFDPFFTTKFTGRGLGLAAVQGIVRGHRGAIKVSSTVGVGTTFRVLLPATTAARRTGDPERHSQPVKANGTILVVDDEDVVRSLASAALQRFGFGVLLAEDGPQALEVLSAKSGEVSAIILDMTMPGPSAEENIRRLRTIKPDVPIILSSGFSEVEALQRFSGGGLAGFLQKPYTAGDLAAKLKSAMVGAS